jgi:hypothetical protein
VEPEHGEHGDRAQPLYVWKELAVAPVLCGLIGVGDRGSSRTADGQDALRSPAAGETNSLAVLDETDLAIDA